MVLEIRLSNFFSIEEEISLDFRAGLIKTKKARSLFQNTFEYDGEDVLKVMALYGPNASGKSNIIKAIRFCHSMILHSHQHNENSIFNFVPFKFRKGSYKPSSYFISFVHENINYEYSFSLSRTEIIEESLFHYPKGSRARVFIRDERAGKSKKEKYTFGASVIKRPMDVAESTSPKSLFLSRASQFDREIPKKIFNYFNEVFILSYLNYSIAHVNELVKRHKSLLLDALRMADSDIKDFKVRLKKEAVKSVTANLLTEEAHFTNDFKEFLEIKTFHGQSPDIEFDFSEESHGTQKIFFIMLTLLSIIRHNKVLLIDEVEESLHPKIVEYIIKVFHNSKHAQLLFTTHNTKLLDLGLFRKDQIWFVNKTEKANTDLYSLFDYKDFRDTMDLEKAYLQGRFDAVPIIDDSREKLKAVFNE